MLYVSGLVVWVRANAYADCADSVPKVHRAGARACRSWPIAGCSKPEIFYLIGNNYLFYGLFVKIMWPVTNFDFNVAHVTGIPVTCYRNSKG